MQPSLYPGFDDVRHHRPPAPRHRPGIDVVLDRLDRVRQTGPGRWIARCPAHDDKNPSLSIAVGDRQPVVLHCHAGCRPEAILDAVDLWWPDVLNERDDDRPRHRPRPAPRKKKEERPVWIRPGDPNVVYAPKDWPNRAEIIETIRFGRARSILRTAIGSKPSQDSQESPVQIKETPIGFRSTGKHVNRVTAGECRSQIGGIIFRNLDRPTEGVWGILQCTGRACRDHGEHNRERTIEHMAAMFGDRPVSVVEVSEGKEWDRLRQRLTRIRDREDDARGHGFKIPVEGGTFLVLNDAGQGDRVYDVESACREVLEIEAHDGRKAQGIGGWTIRPEIAARRARREAAGKETDEPRWVPVMVSEMPRLKVRHVLDELDLDPEDILDEDLPDDLSDGIRFRLPPEDSAEFLILVSSLGAISWEEWLALRGKRSRREREEQAA